MPEILTRLEQGFRLERFQGGKKIMQILKLLVFDEFGTIFHDILGTFLLRPVFSKSFLTKFQ